jgi:hypothetical protein
MPHCVGITSMVATKGASNPRDVFRPNTTGVHVTVPSLSPQVGCGISDAPSPVADAETNSTPSGKVSVSPLGENLEQPPAVQNALIEKVRALLPQPGRE